MAITAVTGFTESFVDTHPFYRATYFRVVQRTASGPGNGTQQTASGRVVSRLDRLVDFHTGFYGNGGRFYLGVRAVVVVTAAASGQGTASSTASVLRQRQATGSGVGSAVVIQVRVPVRTATGSGSGSAISTEDIIAVFQRTATSSGSGTAQASGVRVQLRTGTGAGAGTGSADWNINPARTATGSGIGSSAIVFTRVVPRTSSSQGVGGSTTEQRLTALRTATGTGTGTEASVGARIRRRTSTGSGEGTSTSLWVKSHIFRVPTTRTYPWAERLGEESPDRLFSHTPQGVRAKNLFRLTDGSYTTTDPRRPELIERTYYGGHDIFLTDEEVTELTAAGYGASIT